MAWFFKKFAFTFRKRLYTIHYSIKKNTLAYFLCRVLEYLNFDGNVYKTSITLLRNQDEQGWEIYRGAVFSSKQTTIHSKKREKTQTVTLSTSVPVLKCQLHDPKWVPVQ